MKAPKKPTETKPMTKKQDSTGSTASSGKSSSSFGFDQAMQLANTSVDALKSFTDYKKEQEITRRTQIEGQKDIILSEHRLEEADKKHQEKLIELSNASKESDLRHIENMEALRRDHRNLDITERRQDRVLDQLESGSISAEQAVHLLNGKQD